jgi:HSP20 family protein
MHQTTKQKRKKTMTTLNATHPFDNIVDLFFNERKTTPVTKPIKTAAMNAQTNDKELILNFELPGFSKDEISINLEERSLTVTAKKQKPEDKTEFKTSWLRKEICSNGYKRTVTIPENIDAKNIHAKCENGILTLTLPKKPKEDKTISISIN